MRFFYFLFVVVLICHPPGVFAEFYKYTDGNGVVHFTDDLTMVPKDQRPEMKSYTGSEDPLIPEEGAQPVGERDESQTEAGERDESQTEAGEAAGQQEIKNDTESRKAKDYEDMRKTKAALDDEYSGLLREQEALKNEQNKVKTATEAKAYQAQVRSLNARISDYENRLKAFTEKADAYNAARGK